MSLSNVLTQAANRPARMILHAVEGWGKTSFAAQMPSPIFLMSRGETGLETLAACGLVKQIPHFPEIQTWEDTLDAVRALQTEDHRFQTVVFDAINGFERLCHEFVCANEYGGDWGPRGFADYGKGFDTALTSWREFLSMLDNLRNTKNMRVVFLCHTKITTFKNPEGADYDRYEPDMNKRTWSLTHKWGDMVLFGNFFTVVDTGKAERVDRKGKAKGGQDRFVYTERSAAYDAKNRYNLPPEIDMGHSPVEAWSNFVSAMKSATPKAQPEAGANESEPTTINEDAEKAQEVV